MYWYAIIMTSLIVISYFISKIHTTFRRVLIIASTIVCVLYIIWRLSAIPLHSGLLSFILGLILYLAEVLGLIAFFNFQYLFIAKYKLERKTLADFKEQPVPFVDVLICTYNEPFSLLKLTIVAAASMEYPKDRFKVHVCDDGKREDLKALCETYGVGYITRDDNEGAKAGNINHALGVIQGDLFAVLDADMIPKKEFLKRTVGYFSNENMAFVQTPQVYYNQDMYQYNLKKNQIPNEQDFFMRDIQEARAAHNAVLHVGTNAVFRRQFVLDIGGYPTCSITEDMAVGMLLQAQGHDTVLVNEELVLGLSATTFIELVKQRDRWCRGNLQVLKHFNPIFHKGLTFAQRIAYFDGVVYWFANIQKMIYITWPLIYLYTQTLILDCTLEDLLNMYVPFFIGQYLIFRTLSPKTRSMKWSHYYEVAMAPHLTLSIFKEMLNLKTKFNVTSKELVLDRKSFQFRICFAHVLIAILSIFGWIISANMLRHGNGHLGAFFLNLFWSGYNLTGVIIAIKVAYQKPIFRKNERIEIENDTMVTLKVNDQEIYAKIMDISGQGTKVKILNEIEIKEKEHVVVKIDNVEIPCHAVRYAKPYLALCFENLSFTQLQAVMDVFTTNMHSHYQTKRDQVYE